MPYTPPPGLINPPHHCHAEFCDKLVAPRFFMCPRHWRRLQRVGPRLARAILDNYVPGQEARKDPTAAYIQAAKIAIDCLWLDEMINGYEYGKAT